MTIVLRTQDTNIPLLLQGSLKRSASKTLLNEPARKKIAIDFSSLGIFDYAKPLTIRIKSLPVDIVPLTQPNDSLDDLSEKLEILTTQIYQELTRQPPLQERTSGEKLDLKYLSDLISEFLQKMSEMGMTPHNLINSRARIIAGICEKYLQNGGQNCHFSMGSKINSPQGFLRDEYDSLMITLPAVKDLKVIRDFLEVMGQIALQLPEDQFPIPEEERTGCGLCVSADHLLKSLQVPYIKPNYLVAETAHILSKIYQKMVIKHGFANFAKPKQKLKSEKSGNQICDANSIVILNELATIIQRSACQERTIDINIRIISLCNLALKGLGQNGISEQINSLILFRAYAVLDICNQIGIVYSPIFLVQTYRSLDEIYIPTTDSESACSQRELMGDLALFIPTLRLPISEANAFSVCGMCAAAINHLESLKLSENAPYSSYISAKLENDLLSMDHLHQACRAPFSTLYEKLRPNELWDFPPIFRPIQNDP